MSKSGFAALALFFSTGLFAQQGWTLQQCIEYAIKNNLTIMQANVSSESSEVTLNQTRANVLPTLNAGATHTYNIGRTIDRYTNTFANSTVLSQNFFIGTQVTLWSGLTQYNSIKQNQYSYMASRETLEQRKNDLALNVASNFLQVIYNEELIRIAQSQRDISKEQLDRTKVLVEAGSLAKGNEYDINAQLANDEYTLITAQNNYTLSMLNLKQLLYLDTVNNFSIDKPEFGDPQAVNIATLSVFDIYQTALKNQHNIKSAEYNMLSYEKSVLAAKGRISPSLTFNGSIGTGYSGLAQTITGSTPTGLYNVYVTSTGVPVVASEITIPQLEKTPFGEQFKTNVNKSLGLTLNVPLFNGLSTYSSIKTAQLQSLNAKYNYDLTRQQLYKTIAQAHADALASFNKFYAAKAGAEAAQQAFDFAKQKFDLGSINAFEFSIAKNRLLKAQSDALNAKYDYIFKLKVLDFYQGKPLY